MRADRAAPRRAGKRSSHESARAGTPPGASSVTHGRRRAVLLWTAALVPLLVLLAVVIVGWVGSQRALFPGASDRPLSVAAYAFAGQTETVRFASLDGMPLVGWFIAAGRERAPAVALLHGFDDNRAQLLPHAAYLHANGYHVFLIDFRGRGESGGEGMITLGAREPLDVRAAIAYLRSRPEVDPERIAVQGVSLGASSAIMAMADEPGIAAVVAESPFSDIRGVVDRSFQHYIGLPAFPFAPVTVLIIEQRLDADADDISPLRAIARIGPRPVLIIEDLSDDVMPVDSGVQLFRAAPGPKEYWAVAGAGHADAFDVAPAEYERRVLAFYREYLRGERP